MYKDPHPPYFTQCPLDLTEPTLQHKNCTRVFWPEVIAVGYLLQLSLLLEHHYLFS
jgi:hypothetical protein